MGGPPAGFQEGPGAKAPLEYIGLIREAETSRSLRKSEDGVFHQAGWMRVEAHSPFVFSCSAAEQLCHCFRVALDDLQIRPRCSVRSLAALFPIAQCPDGDAIERSELLLRHTELRAEPEDVHDGNKARLFKKIDRGGVWIVCDRGSDLLIRE